MTIHLKIKDTLSVGLCNRPPRRLCIPVINSNSPVPSTQVASRAIGTRGNIGQSFPPVSYNMQSCLTKAKSRFIYNQIIQMTLMAKMNPVMFHRANV